MTTVGCNCGKRSGIKYEVTFHDGRKQTYNSVTEAQQAGQSTNQPFTFRAVAG